MDYEDKKQLARRLSELLTIKDSEALKLINEDLESSSYIAYAFEQVEINGTHSREWLSRTMTALPRKLVLEKDDYLTIDTSKDSSLFMLYQAGMQEAKTTNEAKNRLILLKALIEERNRVSQDAMNKNEPKVAETSIFDLKTSISKLYPLGEDLSLYAFITQIEAIYYRIYHLCEQSIREEIFGPQNDVNENFPTPHAMIYAIAQQAFDETCKMIGRNSCQETVSYRDLIDQLLCNICGNRVLLEMAEVATQAEAGYEVMIDFVSKLNEHGLDSVPNFQSYDEVESYHDSLFGLRGTMIKVVDEWRPLSGSDMKAVRKFAQELERQYIGTRLSPEHNGLLPLYEKYLFLLVQTALFYTNSSVKGEFANEHRYKPMPWRGKPRDVETQRPHALEMAKSAFSILDYSNNGLELKAEKMRSYPNAMKFKRSLLQTIIFLVFKRYKPAAIIQLERNLSCKSSSGE
ncbi:hypothetical protein [Vibrio rotiferianus]|uniref:hypothetical protein n=1 Tax=Vibrio TaxID=662 RepID=UPI00111069BE|nr:hypothetical protein [Vibrio rotiferianus]TMX57077.1 hypothetical protein DA097_22615 [Vibrio rotiferianus]